MAMAAMAKKDIKMNKVTRERIVRLPIGTKVEVTCGNIAYVGMKNVVVGDDGNGSFASKPNWSCRPCY
jgi:hypothetical protein